MLKNNALSLMLFLALTSCSKEHTKKVSIDPAFQSYVNDFINDGASVGYHVEIDDLTIQFTGNLTAETLGECIYTETRAIVIDAQDWANETDEYKRVVLYHELGHCVLNREHVFTGTILQTNCSATSIMYPDMQSTTNMYSENWSWYVQEMFYPSLFDITSQEPGNYCSYNDYWGGI
jgi:hypothetical protein